MDPLEAARRGRQNRHQIDRKLFHVARRQRQWFIFRTSGIKVLWRWQTWPRSGAGLSSAQGNAIARGRAVAGAIPQLRTRRLSDKTLDSRRFLYDKKLNNLAILWNFQPAQ